VFAQQYNSPVVCFAIVRLVGWLVERVVGKFVGLARG